MKDTPELRQKIFRSFPFLETAAPEVWAELLEYAKIVRLPPKHLICLEPNTRTCIPFVLEGQGRVYKLSRTGREITLGKIEPGQSCLMNASCIVSGMECPAFAATETEVEALVIPPEVFRRWLDRYPVWRKYLSSLLASRLDEVISVIEEVAFERVDARLAEYLLDAGNGSVTIHKTHQEIATDIGTSREVVSRILKEFERGGLIKLSRGRIRTESRSGLEHFGHN